ncbi:MAG TPA: alanine racemase [Pyrinomonadaceae bacterium]|jgi:D-serine deaminase-like pyridoxal phosphate-dependent protein|nr:alanine racemase [Pyrinomonadaceae bacterium]
MTSLYELKTPCLLLDHERMRRNAERMGKRASDLGVRLRPHVKTHKCVEVARIQTVGHGGALTVSTLAEARAFAARGFSDITYAVPIEPGKFDEAIQIARVCERLALITDDLEIPSLLNEGARRAGLTLDLFLKVDCGYHRCGVDPDSPEALEILRRILDSSNLRLAGILTHAGHSYHCRTREEVLAVAREERDLMKYFAAMMYSKGIRVPFISIGSTPTITSIDHLQGIDEVRPGNYIFFDAFQAAIGSCRLEDCALTVLAAVVHRDRALGKVVIDAGAIALSKDRGAVEMDAAFGYGHVLDPEGRSLGLRVQGLSQEHGEIIVPDEKLLDRLKVGTRVRVLANHSCLTAAQHAHYNVLEGTDIVDRWEIERGW